MVDRKRTSSIIHRQQWVDLFISDIATIEPWDSPEPRDSPDPIGKDRKPDISPNRGFRGTSWFCQSDLHQQPGNLRKREAVRLEMNLTRTAIFRSGLV